MEVAVPFGSSTRPSRTTTQHHHRESIDQYGATNPAEFFAVVTETFFEKPRQLRAKHPALYEQLRQFCCQDPAALMEGAA